MAEEDDDTLNALAKIAVDPIPTPPVKADPARVEVTATRFCRHCQGKRVIVSERLGLIRCYHCTTVLRGDPQQMIRDLTAIEARHVAEVERVIDAAVKIALGQSNRGRFHIQDPRLRAVSNIMERWAVGHGNGGEPPDNAIARPPELDPDTMAVIDDVVKSSPWQVRYLVLDWYRRETPVGEIAAAAGRSVRTIYRHHELALDYLEKRFTATGNPTLLRLMSLVVI